MVGIWRFNNCITHQLDRGVFLYTSGTYQTFFSGNFESISGLLIVLILAGFSVKAVVHSFLFSFFFEVAHAFCPCLLLVIDSLCSYKFLSLVRGDTFGYKHDTTANPAHIRVS